MSESIKDGGPAFPTEYFDRALFDDLKPVSGVLQAKSAATVNTPGISPRDYFAAKALANLSRDPLKWNAPSLAAVCYEIADAMLAAREAKQ